MLEWIKVAILGVVEGITEFLPISSTGHLLVVSALLDFKNSLNGTFEIFIQSGAIVAVIIFYRRDLWKQARSIHYDRDVQQLWRSVVIASFPAAILGLVLRDLIKAHLFTQDNSPWIVSIMLILGGIVFIWIERRQMPKTSDTNSITMITNRQALLIGFAQSLALIPGVSRSGASILGGLLVGLNREAATAFSFYLAIPILGGATILELILSLNTIQYSDLPYLISGAIISGVIALMVIGWLLNYVANNNFIFFGIYRIIAGLTILLIIIVWGV